VGLKFGKCTGGGPLVLFWRPLSPLGKQRNSKAKQGGKRKAGCVDRRSHCHCRCRTYTGFAYAYMPVGLYAVHTRYVSYMLCVYLLSIATAFRFRSSSWLVARGIRFAVFATTFWPRTPPNSKRTRFLRAASWPVSAPWLLSALVLHALFALELLPVPSMPW
jgi:hypothetical protein